VPGETQARLAGHSAIAAAVASGVRARMLGARRQACRGSVVIRAAPASPETPDDKEIEKFFRDFYRLVCGFLVTGCGCPRHEAEDVAMDSFLAVRSRWDHVRTLEQPKAYLFKVAKRRFLRSVEARTGRYWQGDPEVHLAAVRDPADAFTETDGRMDLELLAGQLPPRQRQVLWLREVAGFSEADTAQVLSVTPGTVKSQLHDARARLQELLRQAGGDDFRAPSGRGHARRAPRESE
jgi:RNA polymerase sigma factor (sigma-70 family)